MVVIPFVALAFACISLASPLSPQTPNPIFPNDSDTTNRLLLPWSNELIDTGTLQSNISSINVSSLSVSGSPKLLCQGPLPHRAQTILAACQEALRNVPNVPSPDRELTFGPREDDLYDVGLPREYMSTDGSCILLLKVKPPSRSARATPYDVGRAAFSIIAYCFAGDKPAVSGFIQDFGGDNNLVVGFSALPGNIRVTCEGDVGGPGIIESCDTLANNMLASPKRELFVKGRAPSTIHHVELPYTIKHGDRCAMEITIIGTLRPTEYSTWATIYHAVQTISAKCIRYGQAGAWHHLGMTPNPYDYGRLQVRLYDLQTDNGPSSNLTTS